MSKITNDGLTRSGKGCFTHCSCTYMATVGVKGLKRHNHRRSGDQGSLCRWNCLWS